MGFATFADRLKHLKSFSKYHFDPFKKDVNPFGILGCFVGEDWSAELSQLKDMAAGGHEIGFSFYHAETTKRFTPQSQFDLSGRNIISSLAVF